MGSIIESDESRLSRGAGMGRSFQNPEVLEGIEE